MTIAIVAMCIFSALLWRCAFRLRLIAKTMQDDNDWEFRQGCYHYLADSVAGLAAGLQKLRTLRQGAPAISAKQARRLAATTRADVKRWPIRKSSIQIIDQIERTGRAVELEIFDIADVWDNVGEVMLAADRRVHKLLIELQHLNPDLYPTYLRFIRELQETGVQQELHYDA